MEYAIGEILIPLLFMFGLGYLVSWLIHRWRRRMVTSSEWNTLGSRAHDAELELSSVAAARDEAINERSALSSRVATLSTDLDARQTELVAATRSTEVVTADLNARTTELSTLRGELDESNARVGGLESDLNNAQGTIAGYAKLDGEHKTLKANFDKSQARVTELEGAAAKSSKDLAAARSAAEAAEGRATTAEGRVMELEGEVRSAQADLTGARADLSGSGDKISELEAAVAGAAVTAAALKSRESEKSELESALKASRDELDASQSRIADLDAHLAASRSDLDAANARVGELEGELGGAQSQIAGFANLETEAGQTKGELEGAHARIGQLESDLDAANARAGEIDGANARIAQLEGELDAANARAGEIDGANARIGQLEGELDAANARASQAENDLGGAQSQIAGFANLENEAGQTKGELDSARSRIGELEAELAKANQAGEGNAAELGQLRVDLGERDRRIQALENQSANAADPAELDALRGQLDALRSERDAAQGEVNGVRSERDDANARLKALQAQLAAAQAQPAVADNTDELEKTIERRNDTIADLRKSLKAYQDMPEGIQRMASWQTGAWQKGKTKLGTAGSDHTDDLKVISGIGPQMEELLNSFGVISWEQLAALDDAGVAAVDGALEDFPGRITRDEWVEQAAAIMDAGHKPVERAPKKRVKKKPSWQKGTTKLGTPGAGHTDDLKVINGIGPKMEGMLNKFGVTAWEQLGALKKGEVETLNEMIESFPGRIERDEWVSQAKGLVKRFPDVKKRPTRETFLNNSGDDDPFN